jgi:hypothetical protein
MDHICVPEDCDSDNKCPEVGDPYGEGACMGACQSDGKCFYQDALYAFG